MQAHKLSTPIIKLSFLLLIFALAWPGASSLQAVTFDLDYDDHPGDEPSWDPDGSRLTTIVEAAAEVWSDIIKGGFEIRVQYQYENIDPPASALSLLWVNHGYDTNGNGVNDTWVDRVYNARIRVDPRNSYWFVDPTPLINEEFDQLNPNQLLYREMDPAEQALAYDGSPPDLLEAAYYLEPNPGGPAAGMRDMFTVILHEFGHAIGYNDPANDVDSPYRLERHMVWDHSVFAHSERGQGDQNDNHIDTPHALMSYNTVGENRYFPSATDVLVPAKFCHWTAIDMPRKDFVDVDPASSPNYWSRPRYWTGDRVPDAEDQVWIRNGVEAVLNLTDGEAGVLTIDEASRLIVRGARTLSVRQINIGADSVLEISSVGSNLQLVDDTGAPAALPAPTVNGSIELDWFVNQSFHRLTIEDDEAGDGIHPHLSMQNGSTLTLTDRLRLIGGAEATISDSQVVFTNPGASLLELNGSMTLEDGSSVSVHDLDMVSVVGTLSNLSILSGSSFEITNTHAAANTLIPNTSVVSVSGTGSSLTSGVEITVDGLLSLEHGSATLAELDVMPTGSLSVRHRGLLDVAGLLWFRNGSRITISDLNTVVRADELRMSTPVNVASAARLETTLLRLNADVGAGAEAHLELNGAGPVVTTDNLEMKSGHSESARVDHNFGVVTVNNDVEIQAGNLSAVYTLSDGSLTIGDDLRMLNDSIFIMNVNGGTFNLGRIDQQGNAAFTLNLNGGDLHVTGLGVPHFDRVRVAARSTDDAVMTLQNRDMSFNELHVGYEGDAELTLRGPTTVGGVLTLGSLPGSDGQLTFDPVDEWTTLSADSIAVGLNDRGTFIQTNGFVSTDPTGALLVGRGSYELEGGNLVTESVGIGTLTAHSAWFRLRGGRHDAGRIDIGLAGSSAVYQIDSGRLEVDEVIVTHLREGQFIQNNGVSEIAGNMVLGNINARDSIVELNDGEMTIVGELQIGKVERGRGTFTHNGGDLTVRSDLHVGYGVDSFGQFASHDSMEVLGDVIVGSGDDSLAEFRIEGRDDSQPIVDVAGGIRIGGPTGSTGDFHLNGTGLNSPTLWLTDRNIDVGPDGTGVLHLGGGRIRALRNPAGNYDSSVNIHPGNSVQGFGQVNIPVENRGAIINNAGLPLSFMEEVNGDGVVRAEGAGRIEFWANAKIDGHILCDGAVIGLSAADSLEIRGGIHGTGQLDAVGNVNVHSDVNVAEVNVRGRLTQHSGDARPDELHLLMGTYAMNGGVLETTAPSMVGTFQHNNGNTRFLDDVTVGATEDGFSAMGEGTLELSDGIIRFDGNLRVGVEVDPSDPAMPPSWGTVRFTSEKPYVEVAGDFILTAFGRLETVPGAVIRLTGSHVGNTSADPTALAGLSDLEMSFQGDGSVLDTFEAAGDPIGGFVDNFAVGRLTLGASTRLQLVDLVDNGNRAATGSEALFLESLFIGASATLDINGLEVFIQGDAGDELAAPIADGRLFDSTGGTPEYAYDPASGQTVILPAIPEPSVMLMLTPGVIWATSRRKRRVG